MSDDPSVTPDPTQAPPEGAAPPAPQAAPADPTQAQAAPPPADPQSQPGVVERAADDVGSFVVHLPSEVGKALVGATAGFVNQTAHDAGSIVHAEVGLENSVSDALGLSTNKAPDPNAINPNLPVAEASTGTGRLLEGGIQWAEGMASLGKVLGPIKAAGGLLRAGETALRSGAVGAAFFDPYAARLSNLIQTSKSLQNPLTEFLQADPNDSEAQARLKSALENGGLGAAADAALQGVVAISHYVRGDAEAAAEAATKAADAHEASQAASAQAQPETAPSAPQEQPAEVPDGQKTFVGKDMVERPAETPPELQFTPDEIKQTAQRLMGTVAADRVDPFNLRDPDVSPINLKYVQNPEAERSLLTELGNQINEARIARGETEPTVVSHAETLGQAKDIALQLGKDPDSALKWASNTVSNLQDARNGVPALKIYVQSVASALRQHADWAADGTTGPYASEDEFNGAVDALAQKFQEFGAKSQEIGSESGRLLNAHQIVTDGSQAVSEAVQKSQMGGVPDADAARRLMLARIAAAPDTVEAAAQNAAAIGPSLGQKLSSYWINSLLGYTTLVKKGLSDVFKGGIVQPVEQAAKGVYRGLSTTDWGDVIQPNEMSFRGLYRGVTSGDWTQFTQAGGQIKGMLKSIFDTLEFGGRNAYGFTKDAFVSGEQQLDTSAHAGFVPEPTAGGNLGDTNILDAIKGGDYTSAMVQGLGKTLQMPSRLINTLHEFSQQVIYRGRVFGKANTEATLQGLSDADRETFVQNAMRDAFGPNGEATDQEALQYARSGTYSSQLDPKSLSGRVQGWLQDHPLGRVIVPFAKAPANLLYDVYQYTPVAKPVVDGIKSVIGAGGPPAEEQVGRLATGAAIWSFPLYMAYNGMLTDGGSLDPNARKEQLETGWRPHSLVMSDADGTKHYYPIDAIDPFGQVLSMAADMHALSSQLGDEDLGRLAQHAVIAISHDSLSKTYLKSASDLISALGSSSSAQDAESKWQTVLKGMAGGIVPTQLARTNDDPLMRDTRSLIDAMKARLPGWGNTLDRKYNTLGELVTKTPALGPEFVSPFYKSVDTNDEVQQTLSHIANTNPQGFRPPPSIVKDRDSNGPGIDLRQIPSSNGHSAYDRYQELIGNLGGNSPTFREQMQDEIKSNPELWKRPGPDGTPDVMGLQYKAFSAILHDRREAALGQLRSENPQVNNLMVQDAQRGASVLMGGGNAAPPALPGMRLRP